MLQFTATVDACGKRRSAVVLALIGSTFSAGQPLACAEELGLATHPKHVDRTTSERRTDHPPAAMARHAVQAFPASGLNRLGTITTVLSSHKAA
jgi:hypothetical protein